MKLKFYEYNTFGKVEKKGQYFSDLCLDFDG